LDAGELAATTPLLRCCHSELRAVGLTRQRLSS
jgi:hypothetical protein